MAVETHGPMDEATISFISELGRKISEFEYSGDPLDIRYFFPASQRAHTHTHTRLTALFRDYPGDPVPER